MSQIKEYDYKHHYDSPKEPGWYLTNTEWQATKHKATGELSPIAKIAIAKPKLVNNRIKEKLELEFPKYPFPWKNWDKEDFN